ncbi:GMC family oxidoreductase [Aquabacterium sp. J223]|uniref:GMC family oxidoreductase n=1 Tax=Aquabacterium sp. J223 TaxID=2898431 RepID=UPI0021AD6E85|nr:GMC family oxidoreductase N-terminal domain-containing protein [Aquabacterium sp. J223]UUX97071.1 GMC family oxidoreductase N-terminal domain-containing protein [Aquabacterium sp. J223]
MSAPTPASGSAAAYDFIVVGAGAAGCLLANRLSADPGHRVLLLEAGGRTDSLWHRVPVGYRYTIGTARADWCHESEPEPGLGGRRLAHPRGKGLGGSTAINGMVCIRGQAADYDGWRDLGLPGWGWSDVLPLFKRHEDFFAGADAHHGAGGEWRVDAPRMWWPVLDAVHDAAVACGVPPTDDFNRGDNLGVGPVHVNQRQGRRWSAADAFLSPAVRRRPNLEVVTGALADRLLLDGRRAVGVTWLQDGVRRSAHCRGEVVLAAGAFGSPSVLLRSGIGPADHLAELGIETLLHRPGVGANLHDHLQVAQRFRLAAGPTLNEAMNRLGGQAAMALRYLLTRRGPLTMAPCQLGLFAMSRPGLARADIGYNVLAFSRSGGFDAPFDPHPGLTLVVYDLRPTSRGRLRLHSADPGVPPRLLFNFLTTARDRQVVADAMRFSRRLMQQPAMARYAPEELWPGPAVSDDDDAALLAAAAEKAGSIYHPVGTARMGRPDDPLAVVDAQLRVLGIEGLRVADASVMPEVPSGNTAMPTLMVAEQAARFLLLPSPSATAAPPASTRGAPRAEVTPA